jgi:hypothetical protein
MISSMLLDLLKNTVSPGVSYSWMIMKYTYNEYCNTFVISGTFRPRPQECCFGGHCNARQCIHYSLTSHYTDRTTFPISVNCNAHRIFDLHGHATMDLRSCAVFHRAYWSCSHNGWFDLRQWSPVQRFLQQGTIPEDTGIRFFAIRSCICTHEAKSWICYC